MLQFACDEIVLPTGPHKGERFKPHFQPFAKAYLDAIDSGKWNRFIAVGPTQSGKTLIGCVIPCLYHLFEIGEDVIFGVPDMGMAKDKWEKSIYPAIRASRYAKFIPKSGAGSRGGKVEAISFENGATLRFMSAGGDDKNRSGYTSRVCVFTEVDGYDEAGDASREASPVDQIEARTESFGERKRVYMECTASIEKGRIWQELLNGTNSKIMCMCPYCGKRVSLERENLHGWEDSKSPHEAKEKAFFSCPECKSMWTEADRYKANAEATLEHREGWEYLDTFSMRWNSSNNMFTTAGFLGLKEWKAKNDEAIEENSEKKLCQFTWAIPYKPDVQNITHLDSRIIEQRMSNLPRGIAPRGSKWLTIGVDLGKRFATWAAIAWDAEYNGHVVDYGTFEIASDSLGIERATMIALREFADAVSVGWKIDGQGYSHPIKVSQGWVDSGFTESAQVVYEFCREREGGQVWRPCKGYGTNMDISRWYNRPKTTGSIVKVIGDEYHFALIPAQGVLLVEVNSDYWKSFVHARFSTEIGTGAAMTLYFSPDRNAHKSFAKQLTAERKFEEYTPGKGLITKWETVSRANHALDVCYMASAAAHYCGARIVARPVGQFTSLAPKPPRAPRAYSGVVSSQPRGRGFTLPDGRPYFIMNRS